MKQLKQTGLSTQRCKKGSRKSSTGIFKLESKPSTIGSTVTSTPKPYLGRSKSGYIPGLPRVGMVTDQRKRRLRKIYAAARILVVAALSVNKKLYPNAAGQAPGALVYLTKLARKAP